MTGQQGSRSGHRAVPHTADLRLVAWAPTAEGCVREAVRAVVEGFADTSGPGRPGSARARSRRTATRICWCPLWRRSSTGWTGIRLATEVDMIRDSGGRPGCVGPLHDGDARV
ncbi:archease [Kitasatospora aureofaciens]|uniref:archease n=1 Tax=Kitasatospora aureofaciens TaxID=1894 RepID=UPI00340C21B8